MTPTRTPSGPIRNLRKSFVLLSHGNEGFKNKGQKYYMWAFQLRTAQLLLLLAIFHLISLTPRSRLWNPSQKKLFE